MRKIPTLFARNYETDRLVRDEVVSGCEWVLAGEGQATRKFDGQCAMVRAGRLFRRYDAKKGKIPPPAFEPAEPAPDPETGHWLGWIPVDDGPADRWFREAFELMSHRPDGTYKLVGPKVQGGAEREFVTHRLIPHGRHYLRFVPRDFAGLRQYLDEQRLEGVVWWRDPGNPDCDKAKLKRRDYGLPWPLPPSPNTPRNL